MTPCTNNLEAPDKRLVQALVKLRLIDEVDDPQFEALTGGVSSDIWKVTTKERVFCVKRALSKLRVNADWFAPVERNGFEVSWCQIANQVSPGSAPEILAHDPVEMLCAMEFLEPRTHLVWKDELREGRANKNHAQQCAQRLVSIHSATAGKPDIVRRFPRSDIFHAIRLEPYLEATAQQHPDLSARLFDLSLRTAETRLTMIHGDVSPKNILIGPNGPVFLDAECACIGDPAFDLSFCLNHFLLKCLWTPMAQAGFEECFESMTARYLAGIDWENPEDLEARAASLLPGLLLARVDGKSTVEYVTDARDKEKVRRCARELLVKRPSKLLDVLDAWKNELNR